MARKKQHRCDFDTARKCQELCFDLAHYHLAHAPEVCRKNYTWFEAQIDGFPDVFVISDPKARAAFREFAAQWATQQSKAVKELERLYGLPAPTSIATASPGATVTLSKGPPPAPGSRSFEASTNATPTQKKKDS